MTIGGIEMTCKNCGHSDESHSNVDYRDHSILPYKRCREWSDNCADNCDCMDLEESK